jgi:integrase
VASVSSYNAKDGSKRYRVRYRKPDHSSTDKRGFKRKKDAEDYAARLTAYLNDGEYVDPRAGLTRVEELGSTWLAGKRAVMKPSSYHSIEVSWRVWVRPKWGSRPVRTIRRSELQTWVSEMASERSASIVLRAHGVMNGILRTAKDDGIIRTNPAEGLDLPRKRAKPRRYLSARQVVELADACGRYRSLVLLLGLCGLRWGEATGLRVHSVDPEANRITVEVSATKVGTRIIEGTPKSGKARQIPMPGIVREALKEQCRGKGPDDLVFTGPDGSYVRQQSSAPGNRGWFRNGLIAAGLPMMTPHDLRHSAASIIVHNGGNVKVLQRMLGHASAAMTLDRYSDLFDGDLDAIADAIDSELEGI